MSTLAGWAVVSAIVGFFVYREFQKKWAKDAVRAKSHRHSIEEKKAPKEKAKRQRGEAYSKDVEETAKAAQAKARVSKPVTTPSHAQDISSDDGVDNREFAKQLASVKQGTNLNAPKKSDEKRQRSVKQSRAREIDEVVSDNKPSAPSSTAGADADDDQSSVASPEVKAADAGDVSDMLEPKSAGPAVLRLTDTDKVKQKEKKAKAPEKVESKKQRQNRQKAEAAKLAREEAEKQRQVLLEKQRREARIAEGRAAKDGSAFMAAQAAKSVWTGNGANSNSVNDSLTNGHDVAVQPLDTFNESSKVDAPNPKVEAPKAQAPKATKADSWMSSLPSEEEQLEILRGEEEWNTVPSKKAVKNKKKEPVAEISAAPVAATEPKQSPAAVSQPAKPAKNVSFNTNGKPAKPAFSQQSSFAALSTNDDEVEEEWDV